MGTFCTGFLETISEPVQVCLCLCAHRHGGSSSGLKFTILRLLFFFSSHVLTEDTLSREVRSDGKLHSKRILTKTNRVPKWGERFFKGTFVCIIEESVVDPHEKKIVTYTRNIGFNKIMVWWRFDSFFSFLLNFCISECLRESYLHTVPRVTRKNCCPPLSMGWFTCIWLQYRNSGFRCWQIQEKLQ